jgi:hypothetical protein
MRTPGRFFLLPMWAAGLLSVSAHAQVAQPTSVLAAGGGAATGPGYVARGTLGQPVVGLDAAPAYANGAGFWFQVHGLPGSSPSAVTRYVAPTGNDTGNDCTNPANPCATIAHAVAQANDGDTLDLAEGTYVEPGLVIDKNLLIQGQGVVVR